MRATLTISEQQPTGQATMTGLVVTDAKWVIRQISLDQHRMVAVDAVGLLGTSILDQVHPGDHADLHAAADYARSGRTAVSVVVQMGGPGRWSPVRLTVNPMFDGQVGLVVNGAADDVDERAVRLERHLWRIAREIDAAGLAVDTGTVPVDPVDLIDDLSPRQAQILRSLLEGQRVPSIARSLFLSASTVRNHLTAIFAKLGVHSQEELIQLLRTTGATSSAA